MVDGEVQPGAARGQRRLLGAHFQGMAAQAQQAAKADVGWLFHRAVAFKIDTLARGKGLRNNRMLGATVRAFGQCKLI